MLATFLIILGLLLLGRILGGDVLRCLRADVERFSPVSVIWVGLGIWSCCLLGMALFAGIPVSVYLVAGVYVLVRAGLGWRQWITRGGLRSVRLPVIAAAVSSLFSRRGIGYFDTWLYHMSAVKWYSAFGIVPGLALFQKRLGWTCSWFALDASLNHGLLAERVYALPGLLILTLLIWQTLTCLEALRRRAGALSDVAFPAAFLCVFACCWKSRMLASCTPDFAVIGLTLQIIYEASCRLFGKETDNGTTACIPLFLVVAAIGFSFKLSFVGFILLAGVMYLGKLWRDRRSFSWQSLVPAGMAGSILLIGAAASVRASGFPFFPIPAGRLDLPWSVTMDEAVSTQRDIFLCARYGLDAFAKHQGFWLPTWAGQNPGAAAAVLGALLAVVVLALDRRGMARFLAALGGVGTAVFLLKAPDMRFGLGLFCGLISVAICLGLQPWIESVSRDDRLRRVVPPLMLVCSTGLLLLIGVAGLHLSAYERIARQLTLANQTTPAREMVQPLVPVTLTTGSNTLQLSVAQFEERTTPFGVNYSIEMDAIGHQGPGRNPGNHDLMSTFELTTENIAFRDPGKGPAGGFYRRE
jgi:hypothetical protein